MAREERTEAEMTIPGRRTRREMLVACEKRVVNTLQGKEREEERTPSSLNCINRLPLFN